MLLVAGGQLDPNIGTLLRRVLERGVPFRDLLVGPELTPRITIDVRSGVLRLEGEEIVPTGCFIRHDVFLHQRTGNSLDHTAALNWFYALRGWCLSHANVCMLNRHSYLSENNKVENLTLAAKLGFETPHTVVTNEFATYDSSSDDWIQKPVAGGDYTTLLKDLLVEIEAKQRTYPRFVQPRLHRPELRIYRVGPSLFGFQLFSPELDYRSTQSATIKPADVPDAIRPRLFTLFDQLGLDFGAADFMQDRAGRLYFLEVNSQPMFAAFDRVVSGRLADAMIDLLVPAA